LVWGLYFSKKWVQKRYKGTKKYKKKYKGTKKYTQKGEKMNNSDVRKSKILKILRKVRFITMEELASILNVSSRTIRRDFEYLRTTEHKIIIKRGIDGGVYYKD